MGCRQRRQRPGGGAVERLPPRRPGQPGDRPVRHRRRLPDHQHVQPAEAPHGPGGGRLDVLGVRRVAGHPDVGGAAGEVGRVGVAVEADDRRPRADERPDRRPADRRPGAVTAARPAGLRPVVVGRPIRRAARAAW